MAQQAYDDQQVDEILARAGQLEIDAAGQLDRTSLETLEASAEEAGIDRALVRQAVKQLETEWRVKRAARRQRQALLRNGGIALVVVIFLALGGGMMQRAASRAEAARQVAVQQAQVSQAKAQLATLKAAVDQADAQLRNVTERRDALRAGGTLNDPIMRDEMVGAENRIAVERRRYNDAVTTYNAVARSLGDPAYPELPLK